MTNYEQEIENLQERIRVLENREDNDTIYDDTDLKDRIGYDNIPQDENIQNEINTLIGIENGIVGTLENLQENKAEVNHTHSYNDLEDKPEISGGNDFNPYILKINASLLQDALESSQQAFVNNLSEEELNNMTGPTSLLFETIFNSVFGHYENFGVISNNFLYNFFKATEESSYTDDEIPEEISYISFYFVDLPNSGYLYFNDYSNLVGMFELNNNEHIGIVTEIPEGETGR